MSRKFTAANNRAQRSLALLTAVADGLLVFEATGRYRSMFLQDGLAGVRWLVAQEERHAMLRRYRELRRQRWIRERKEGARVMTCLTREGGRKLLHLRMLAAPRRTGRVLVIYDIPEDRRKTRDALRWLLKSAGFTRVQQSVWSSHQDVGGMLVAWIAEHRLEKWIRVHEID